MPARKPREVTFVSKHESLRIVRRSAVDTILPNGQPWVKEPEKVYEFHAGRLVLRPGQDVMTDWVDGTEVEQDAIAYFRSEPAIQEFFQEVEPVIPDSGPEFKTIAGLAARGDVESLQKPGDEEAAEWAREDVLEAINDALNEIEKAEKARAEAEVEKPKAAAK